MSLRIRTGRLAAVGLIVALGGLGGCRPNSPKTPPALRLGEESCAECRMIISDGRFAAALVTEDGEALKFDDLGCLVRHEKAGLQPATTYWVRSYTTEEWLDPQHAVLLHAKSLHSPMGYGLAAVPAEDAGKLDAEARKLRFSEAPAFLAAQR